MTIFITYMIFLSTSSIVCVLALRYFALTYIYNTPAEMFSPTFYVNLLLTLLLLVIASAVAYLFSRPFDKSLRKMKKGYLPSDEEKLKCLRSIRNLNLLTISANLLGFFIGQVYMVIDGLVKGRITNDPVRIFLIIAQAVAFGSMSAMFAINGLDKSMNKYRKYLHLHDINEQKYTRALSVATSITMTTLMCFGFIGINMMGTIYGAITTGAPELFTKNGFLCLIFSIIIAIPPFLLVIQNLVDRIRFTKVSLDEIAFKGDLSSRIDITTLDNFGDMTTSINMLIDKLSGMIRSLSEKTEGVSRAADVITETTESAQIALQKMSYTMDQITGNSDEQNRLILQADKNIEELAISSESVQKKAVEQSDAVQNISASIAEMSANINSVADTAKKAQDVSEELSATSADGRSAIQNAIETMKEIQQAGEQVQLIIKSIQEITSQTNLLSMNAAIEAAHAGDFGIGFAVVADEVRSLAASSSESTKHIQAHIKNMSDKIKLGVETINIAGEAFNNISQKVEENAQFVNTIFGAMEEQRIGTQETQQSTYKVVDAVNTVNQLASEETRKALEIREFMQTVITASKTTNDAIANSSDATSNLGNTILAFKENAANNKEAVEIIQNQMRQFKV